MSSDLLKAQHRHAAFLSLGSLIMERFLGTDGSEPEAQVLCESAAYQDRFVSQEAWFEIYAVVQQHIQAEQADIATFRTVRAPTVAAVREKARQSLLLEEPVELPEEVATGPEEQEVQESTEEQEEANDEDDGDGEGSEDSDEEDGGNVEPH